MLHRRKILESLHVALNRLTGYKIVSFKFSFKILKARRKLPCFLTCVTVEKKSRCHSHC